MTVSEGPRLYNMKAVTRETGLGADTLRAWERRYGVPQPDRTAGRHRLYSQADIDMLKWLVARQREGLSISRAVDLWRQLAAEGRTPSRSGPTAAIAPRADSLSLDNLRQAWIAACMHFDEQEAEAALSQAFAVHSFEEVCHEVLCRGLADVGDAWYEGRASVQQEHFASALAIRQVGRLIAATPAPTRPVRVLISCPAGEDHTFGLVLLDLLCRRRGWSTVFLGGNVPIDRLDAVVAETGPNLAVLTAARLTVIPALVETSLALDRLGIPVAYGGPVFNALPSLRTKVPGHFLAKELSKAMEGIAQLLAHPRSSPALLALPADAAHYLALEHFLSQRAAIEADVQAECERAGMPTFRFVGESLGGGMIAALTLDDLSLLDAEIAWISGLLQRRQIAREQLDRYLAIYARAAQRYLGPPGAPIVQWLQSVGSGAPSPPAPSPTEGRGGEGGY